MLTVTKKSIQLNNKREENEKLKKGKFQVRSSERTKNILKRWPRRKLQTGFAKM